MTSTVKQSPSVKGAAIVFEHGRLPSHADGSLEDLPLERRSLAFKCTSGRRLAGEWVGIAMADLLAVGALPPTTTHLLVDSALDYTACVSIADAMDGLLAFEETRFDCESTQDVTPRLVGTSIDTPRTVKRVSRITGLSLSATEDPTAFEYLPD